MVLGSENPAGHTKLAAEILAEQLDCPIVNLLDIEIGRYSYTHNYSTTDGFIPLIDELTSTYDTFIFATPVYWYSMSGLLKIFFDRFTDLLKVRKDIGRRFKGKSMAVISSSNSGNLGSLFWLPFQHSAEYLGMDFLGGLHTIEGEKNHGLIKEFSLQLNK